MAEIRRHRRYPVRRIVSCQNGRRKFLTLTVNLSLGGMKIEIPYPLGTNETLKSELVLDRKAIPSEGRVVYSYSDLTGQGFAGIEFAEMAQEDRKVLKRFLMKQKKSPPKRPPRFREGEDPVPEIKDTDKSREQLIEELSALRNRLAVLEWERKESRRAMQVLDETEERFQEFCELLPVGMAEYDLEMNLKYANRFLYEMFGYSEEDFKRRPDISQVLAPEEVGRARKAIERLASGEAVGPGEYRLVRKGGERFYGEVHSVGIVRNGMVVGIRSGVQDITDRKRAELSLRESYENLEAEIEKRTLELTRANQELQQSQVAFRRLFEADIIGIIQADSERIYDANDAFLKLVGYTREDLFSGRIRWREITPPEHRYQDEQSLQEMMARGSCTPFEKEYVRKDGSRVPILIGATVIEESPLRWICFVLDISLRKHLEEELRKTSRELEERVEERTAELAKTSEILQTIVDHIPVMLCAYDNTGKVRFVNREFERRIGLSFEEAQKTDIMAECYPDPAYRRDVWEYMMKGTSEWRDFRVRCQDGNHLESSWANVRLSDGSQIGIGIDITKRRQAEEALRISESRLAAAIESSGAGIYEHSVPLEQGCYHSERWANILGYTREELPPPDRFFAWQYDQTHADDREGLKRAYTDFVEGRTSTYDVECRMRHKTGRWVYVRGLSRAVKRDETGRITHIVGVMVDITQEKKREERLRFLSAKLQGVHEEERKRVARDLHDSIGSALATIKLGLSRKLERIGDAPPPPGVSLEEIMDRIQHAIRECRRIQVNLRPSILDDIGLLAAINWQCREFETLCPHIRVEKQIEAEESDIPEPLKIVLFRVLQESLNNIQKHSQGDLVNLYLSKSDAAIELCIHDNGQGFDPQEIGLRGRAMGMGLESMQERVRLSGGSFRIQSGKGAGTTVRVAWPCKEGILIT
jgi:PAS domain S-box-containing protein